MAYISAASTISHQPTFKNAGFSALLEVLGESSALINPEYKEYIDAGLLRRMSKILRMSVACAKECIQQAEIEQPGAIIVGTGLGCLLDTEKFLNNSITIEGLLPPTSFIQSTHNTMGGQISLSIGNHGYNMTHTQNTLSFEHALQDAMLLLAEGEENILVGAADEHIEFLSEVAHRLHVYQEKQLTSGASFFVVSNEKTSGSLAKISDAQSWGLVSNVEDATAKFLKDNNVDLKALDLILYAGNLSEFAEIDTEKCIDYTDFSGIYPTASSFALHYAVDSIAQNKPIRNVLIYNALIKNNLGLMLVQSLEA
ncbi:beta-ketoacyl synthase chain length factor [Dyadobacter luticola]|uniref:Beta-ketoacyl synthase chain length factor n=1 Tax=Dyadobacter luticola TaxID=1979387 RepID=A0A5R9L5M3_9BACT|nr:beta-ketoacyl synthase chain length factor [Dyadobacter luticola]TLV03555.1 beta-ketoacyl synthase chain length factor [Dyadobacter luticola]